MPVRYRYRCPRCDAQFISSRELAEPPSIGDETSSTAIRPINAKLEASSGSAQTDTGAAPGPVSAPLWSRLAGWLVVPAVFVVIVLLAWLASVPEVLVAAALLLTVAGAYAWRARMFGGMLPTRNPGSERGRSDASVDGPPPFSVDVDPAGNDVEIIAHADGSVTRIPSRRL